MSPKVPIFLPLYSAPNASQQSSTRNKLYLFAILTIFSNAKGFPNVCAITIALVLLVIAFSIFYFHRYYMYLALHL